MATWDEVRAYVLSNYEVDSDRGDGVTVLFSFSDGTSQKVVVADRGEMWDEHWIGIFTVVAQESQVNLRDVLVMSGDLKFGGLGLLPFVPGGTQLSLVILQHAVPLSKLDENDLALPMQLIAELGDHIERQLTGRDVF
jgi:hypothetical protein